MLRIYQRLAFPLKEGRNFMQTVMQILFIQYLSTKTFVKSAGFENAVGPAGEGGRSSYKTIIGVIKTIITLR